MAKDAKREAQATEAAPKKSRKLLIIVAAALVLALLIGGAGAFFLFGGHDAEGDADEEVAIVTDSPKKREGKKAPPIYLALDTFTVNLVPENGEQFLQLAISVEVAGTDVGEKLKSYTPKLRNNIMMLVSSKRASELLTKEGKETLAGEIRDLMNQILEPKAKKADAPIREVLFTSFIIQ